MSQVLTGPQLQVPSWQSFAGQIDHTLLKPDVTASQITHLCEEAVFFGFAAVCVNPTWTALAASLVRGTTVKVATTVGFPLGATSAIVKRFEASEAIRMGAQELDMVINVGALKSGDRQAVLNEISGVVALAHPHGVAVKVIIETPLLSLEEKIYAAQLSLALKADFVKTATGHHGATSPEDVSLIRGVVGNHAGVKAAGGIRSAQDMATMIDAGANRIGSSSGIAIVRELGAPEFPRR